MDTPSLADKRLAKKSFYPRCPHCHEPETPFKKRVFQVGGGSHIIPNTFWTCQKPGCIYFVKIEVGKKFGVLGEEEQFQWLMGGGL